MTIETRLYTADDLWELSHEIGDAKQIELVRGEIVEMTPTGGLHGVVVMNLAYFIASFVKAQKSGYVIGAETGFILSDEPYTVRAPDVAFIAASRMPHPIPPQYFPLAPDLAVEVVSPHDKARQIREKVIDFLGAGTRLMWVVYPEAQTVDVYRPDQDVQVVGIDGALDGADVLPGFNLPLGELFKSLEE